MNQRSTTPTRNWHAVNAHFRKAGAMKDRSKEASRSSCRKPAPMLCNRCGVEALEFETDTICNTCADALDVRHG